MVYFESQFYNKIITFLFISQSGEHTIVISTYYFPHNYKPMSALGSSLG